MTSTISKPITTTTDYLLIMSIRALLYSGARTLATALGPDLYPAGPARFLARVLIVDPAPDLHALPPRRRAQVSELLGEVERTTIPDDEGWAVHIVRVLAERRYAPILASSLRWAADEVERGASVRWLRLRMVEAFDIAEGIRPFDSAATWAAEGSI